MHLWNTSIIASLRTFYSIRNINICEEIDTCRQSYKHTLNHINLELFQIKTNSNNSVQGTTYCNKMNVFSLHLKEFRVVYPYIHECEVYP